MREEGKKTMGIETEAGARRDRETSERHADGQGLQETEELAPPCGLETPTWPKEDEEQLRKEAPKPRRRRGEERARRHIPDAGPLFGPWGKWGTRRDGWVTE